MKELSLNILDIAENSVRAKATLIEIIIDETDDILNITVKDNGIGIKQSHLNTVTDPFFTTRKSRSVGMGIPLIKFAAEQTGGQFEITSISAEDCAENHGTTVNATFYKNHIDFVPLGDITETLVALIISNPEINFRFVHKVKNKTVFLDTVEFNNSFKDAVLDIYKLIGHIKKYLDEQYKLL